MLIIFKKSSALSHLHSNGIVHRNVEPRSVLINNDGHILLSDFSNAGYLSQATTATQRVIDFSRAEKTTVTYCAPELLLGWAHDAAVDCWSFGAVFYFLVFGHVRNVPLFQLVLSFLTSSACVPESVRKSRWKYDAYGHI